MTVISAPPTLRIQASVSNAPTPRQPSSSLPAGPLRVAIVGGGAMGRHHAAAIGRIPDRAKVVAVADPAPDVHDAVKQVAPEARIFGNLDELLASCDVDVIHVCTAPHTHEALAERVLA